MESHRNRQYDRAGGDVAGAVTRDNMECQTVLLDEGCHTELLMSSPEGDRIDKPPIGARIKGAVRKKAKQCCSKDTLEKKVPFSKWIREYSLYSLQCDIIAGITVGLTVIPQGLAYSIVAGLPPQHGLYSAFMGSFTYIFLGTSKDITLGPTALMSLMTAAFASTPVEGDPTYAILLCFFAGIFQFTLGILNLGFLVNFISFPVINGFTSAAAIIIGFGQLKDLLGIKHLPREFIERLPETFEKIPETNVWDLTMGVTSLALLIVMKKMKAIQWNDPDPDAVPIVKKVFRKIIWLLGTARNAVIVLITTVLAAILLEYDIDVLSLTGNIKQGFPEFKPPSFTFENGNITRTTGEVFGDIGAGIVIVPLLGILETIAISKAFARKNKYKIDPSQEMVAIGIGNLVSCFVGAYPVTGSFSRTAVNSQSGVVTPMGGLFTGALVLLALGVLTPYFYFIPKSALAAVIIGAVLMMIDYKVVRVLWKVNKIDVIPLVVTFVTSFVIGIEYGILIGVGLSILMVLHPLARPKVKTIEDTSSNFCVMIESGIVFPAAEYIETAIAERASENSATTVIVDCKQMSMLDFTSIQGITQLQAELHHNGKVLILTNLKSELHKKLVLSGMKDFTQEPGEEKTKKEEAEGKGENGLVNGPAGDAPPSHASQEDVTIINMQPLQTPDNTTTSAL